MAITFDGNASNYALKAIAFSASKGTLMAWVRIAVDTDTYATFFQTNNGDGQQFVVETDSTGLGVSLYINNSSNTGSTLVVGAWNHLALTWNGTQARVYLNGVVDASVSDAGSTWNEVRLGVSYWGEPLNGNIAHIKAWDAALSLAQIQTEIPSIAAVKTSNLVGEWKTPIGAGRLLDTSGLGNHLVATGTITDYANPIADGATRSKWLQAGSSFF